MKINQKLTLGFVSVALLAGLVGTISILQNKKSQDIVEEKVYRSISHLGDVWELMEAQEHQEIAANNYLFLHTGLEERMTDYFYEKERLEKIYQRYSKRVCQHVKPLVEKYYKNIKIFHTETEKAFELHRQRADSGVIKEKVAAANKYAEIAHKDLELIIDHVYKKHIEPAKKSIAGEISRTTSITILISVIAVFLAISLGLIISRSIYAPLTKLGAAAAELGEGKLETKIDVRSNDEIGELAASFNEMAGKLKEFYSGLEEKVQQRTAELTSANESLEAEIKQRIKVEETLRENRKELNEQYKFLNSVLESLTHPFYVIDANDYTITIANSATYPERLPEKATCYLFLHERDKPCEKCLLNKIKKTKEPVTVERTYYDEDGKPKYVEIHGYPVFDSEGNLSQIIAYSFDITERKKAEQRQAELIKEVEYTNQELKDFAYIVSHDLKAPLRGIGTLTEWLSTDYKDKFDEEGKQELELLLGRVERMQNLIDGILEYSRVGRMDQEKVQVNLNELVSGVIDMVAPPDNIKITLENELPVVWCEQTRITQVFANLLSNAIKYMDKPQGQIKISCIEQDGFWKFGVADNGPGIEDKHFERIFRIFQTLEPQDKTGGTGLGLTVIKKIVELYDGRIWLESKLGQGSTFYFTLPKQESSFCEALQKGLEEMGVKDEKLKADIVS